MAFFFTAGSAMWARMESRVFSAGSIFSCADDEDGVDAFDDDDVEGGVNESELFDLGEGDVEGGVNEGGEGGGGGSEKVPVFKH